MSIHLSGALSSVVKKFKFLKKMDSHPSLRALNGQIASLEIQRYGNMDIKETMSRVGLTQQIQSAIADPAFSFSDMLWTRNLHFGVKDTICTKICTNYAIVLSRQELLRCDEAAESLIKTRQQNEAGNVRDVLPSEEVSAARKWTKVSRPSST